jgi:hypothetical protein
MALGLGLLSKGSFGQVLLLRGGRRGTSLIDWVSRYLLQRQVATKSRSREDGKTDAEVGMSLCENNYLQKKP